MKLCVKYFKKNIFLWYNIKKRQLNSEKDMEDQAMSETIRESLGKDILLDSQERSYEEKIEALNSKIIEQQDSNIRLLAEMDNLRKRSVKDVENAHKFGLDSFVRSLLEVNDSLAMGIKISSDDNSSKESISEGMDMTRKVFLTTMEKFGVNLLDPKGGAFNPEYHEAVTMVDVSDGQSNTVLEVVQSGFTLNGRLIRPAMVVVIK